MAVKQNNAEASEEDSNNNNNNKAGEINSKKKIGEKLNGINKNCDKQKIKDFSEINEILHQKKSNLSEILHFIEVLDKKFLVASQEMFVYKMLIVKLSHVHLPRNQAEDLKIFKDDIKKVGQFFLAQASEKRIYCFYLETICFLITQTTKNDYPSCAIAIIFELFDDEMIYECVNLLLDYKIPDENVRKTVRLLCEWLRMCNFCRNLHTWILAILQTLHKQQKFLLSDEIAAENIELLYTSTIIPCLRPKCAPIVVQMLSSIYQTPQIFYKIIPKYAIVINCLKNQSMSNEEYAEDAKLFIQQSVDIANGLMLRFSDSDDLYKSLKLVLKNYQPTYKYLDYANPLVGEKFESEFRTDSMLENNTNVKVGLVNLGNTCYMNSVLQALAMTKEFSRGILLSDCESPLVMKMKKQIALMLYSRRYELTPSPVLNATRPPGFLPGVQQDSSEFLGYLLETLHEQEIKFNKNFPIPINGACCDDDGKIIDNPISTKRQEICQNSTIIFNESQHISNLEGNEMSSSSARVTSTSTVASVESPMSTIENTFSGKLATTYKCLTCGWKSRNVDTFRDLQLSFPEMENECAPNYSVQDLIEYYCSPEKLDGENQYFCERCKKLSDAERYISIISAPKNLILTLKHFKYDQKYHMRAKLMHKVFHDEKIAVKICSSESFDEVAMVHYDLYAGVVHSGFSMDSGHYYTYASDANKQWYKFNDNIVTHSKSEELHNLTPPNTPYILFYQMAAHSNPENMNSICIQVQIPNQLSLDELPHELRDYVNHDNYIFNEELLRIQRINEAKSLPLQDIRRYDWEDDDDEQPPRGGGCGGNALGFNINRFVF